MSTLTQKSLVLATLNLAYKKFLEMPYGDEESKTALVKSAEKAFEIGAIDEQTYKDFIEFAE